MKRVFGYLCVIISLFLIFSNDIDNNINVIDDVMLSSSGATGGYLVNKPFDLSVRQSSYISSTGYLYAAGYNHKYEFGNNSNTVVTSHFRLYKNGDENDTFRNVRSWGFGWQHGIVVDEDGKVFMAGTNDGGRLGLGETSTSYVSKVFTQVNNFGGNEEYNAISTAPGYFHSVVLLDDNTLWASGSGTYFGKSGNQYSYVEISLPKYEEENTIVDYSGGYSSTYVLYSNGDLWRIAGTNNTQTLIATNIKFFDVDGSATYGYAVTNDNEVLFGKENTTSQWTPVKDEIIGDVIQIRGGGITSGSSWGYLNSDGDLYVSEKQSDGQGALEKIDDSHIRYFDIGSSFDSNVTTWGYLTKFSQMYLWGANGEGQLATGSTSSGLADPSHSESSLVIPSLDADFTGLFSIDPNIRRSYNDEILDPTNLSISWREEGFLYVDYSTFDFDDEKLQKIEVVISNAYGIVDTFTLDKSFYANKNGSYTKKPGSYTVSSQLHEYIDGEWRLVGSANTTVFEMRADQVSIVVDEEGFANQINLIKLYNNRNVVPELKEVAYKSFLTGDLGFSDDLYYYHNDYVEKYKLTSSNFSVRIYRKTSSGVISDLESLTSITSSYTYYIEINIVGLEDYYHNLTYTQQFTLESRTIYQGTNARFEYLNTSLTYSQATTLTYYNSGIIYDIGLLNISSLTNFNNTNYQFKIVIIGTNNFSSEFFYDYDKTYNNWIYMPKEVGTYTVVVYMYEVYDYGTIEYPLPSSNYSRSLTISKASSTLVTEINTEVLSDAISGIPIATGVNSISLIEKAIEPYLHGNVTFGANVYEVVDGLFVPITITNDIVKYYFFKNSSSITSITTEGEYRVAIGFGGNSNYNANTSSSSTNTKSFDFNVTQRYGLLHDSVVFDNDTNEVIYYSSNQYDLTIRDFSTELYGDNYEVIISITDSNGFFVSYDYKNTTNIWMYMPKLVGEYSVVTTLTDTDEDNVYVSRTYSTLYVREDDSVCIEVDSTLNELLDTFLTKDEFNIIDDILSVIKINYLNISSPLYNIVRENGYDVIKNVVVPTLLDYSFEIYKDNELVNLINSEGSYSLVIKYNGINGIYELTCDTIFNFDVETRYTLNNIEVSNKVGANAYFTDEFDFYLSRINFNYNNGTGYGFVIDAISDLDTYFTSDIYNVVVSMTSGNDVYTFDYINPKEGTIDFNLLPKKSGDYEVVLSLYNTFDDYVSKTTTLLSITEINISLLANDIEQIYIDENKTSLNNEIINHYKESIYVQMYGHNQDTLCTVINNKYFNVKIDTVLEYKFYLEDNGSYIEVEDVIEDGSYKLVVSVSKDYDNYNYDEVEFNFNVNKVSAPISTIVICVFVAIALILICIIFFLRRSR